MFRTRNGVVDIAVADEAEAVAVAKKYLSYCQGPTSFPEACGPAPASKGNPGNRVRVYDMHAVIEMLADTGSVLELRRHFRPGMITALVRIKGRPFGLVANDPMHMGGAIEAEAADKAARFMQLCNAHGLPIYLCVTPRGSGGPRNRDTRPSPARMPDVCYRSKLDVRLFTVVLRKGYGLGNGHGGRRLP